MAGRYNICITFVGDITKDSRAQRFSTALQQEYDVTAVTLANCLKTFELEGVSVLQLPVMRRSSLKMSLFKFWRDGFAHAIDREADLYLAGDLYSLPIAARAAQKRNAQFVYDSRELYSSIAALSKRRFAQYFWRYIEWRYARNAALMLTVNHSIADRLRLKYRSQNIAVIHNYPKIRRQKYDKDGIRKILRIPKEMKVLLSQGGIQKGRGSLRYLEALERLPDCVLVFLGSGEFANEIKNAAEKRKVSNRVYFLPAVPSNTLLQYTASADIGLCVIENLGQSYYLSLPNKLFEYIAVGIPVVGSNFPEISAVITKNKVGLTVDPNRSEQLTDSIRLLLDNQTLYSDCSQNCLRVRELYNWEVESKILLSQIADVLLKHRII